MEFPLIAFLLVSLFSGVTGFYNNIIQVYFCERSIQGSFLLRPIPGMSKLHHEIWLRDLQTGGTTLITFSDNFTGAPHFFGAPAH